MTAFDEDAIKLAMIDLAADVAKAAGKVDTLADKIDALKTLAQVYGILKKHNKNEDPDEDQGDDFNFSKGVDPKESSNVSQIPTRRRPG